MKSNTVTCSFIMDRDVYISAIQEVEALKKDPAKKVYSSFSEALKELEDDE